MKRILLPFACLLLFASCKLHVFTVDSSLKQLDNHYVFENDTLRIEYDLWMHRGQMKFTVYNKLNIPLFIDWKNSAFIQNDDFTPYWKDITDTKSSYSGVMYKGMSSGASSGNMYKKDRVSFIPPQSKISKYYEFFLCKSEVPSALDASMRFRNYIAYSVNEDTHGENFSNSEFKVKEVKKISRGEFNTYKSPMNFYTEK